ncbi:MAG: hypothetical protein JW936_01250 [Sedimentisphaerales bacterium]|nr:hypothetical protein [Sedimentisphaerales bacterium]
MPLPIIEQITADVAATIAELCEAEEYDIDLTVVRSRRSDFSDVTPAEGVVALVNLVIRYAAAAGQVQPQTAVYVAEMYVEDSSDSAVLDTRINARMADVIKKLLEDAQRATLASDTRITGVSKFFDSDGFSGADIEFEIDFRTLVNDPYTKIG